MSFTGLFTFRIKRSPILQVSTVGRYCIQQKNTYGTTSHGDKQIVWDFLSCVLTLAHINNLQNTCFWSLVASGLSTTEANKALSGTDSKNKNELLFSRFNINYNTLPARYRKGSVLVREAPQEETSPPKEGQGQPVRKAKKIRPYEGTSGEVTVLHEDIIKDGFWKDRPWLLM